MVSSKCPALCPKTLGSRQTCLMQLHAENEQDWQNVYPSDRKTTRKDTFQRIANLKCQDLEKEKRILCQLTRSTTAWALPRDLKVHDNINLPNAKAISACNRSVPRKLPWPQILGRYISKGVLLQGFQFLHRKRSRKKSGSKNQGWIGGIGDRT